jgi:transcription initiation factor TFIIH subunit 4
MEAEHVGGNRLKLKLTKVKVEADTAPMADDDDDEEVQHLAPPPAVKREVIELDDDDDMNTAIGASLAPLPPKPSSSKRPSFSLSADPAAAASSASAAAASPAAVASSAPLVMNQTTMRMRLKKRPKSILDYLCSLDKGVLDVLYQDTFTCLTIFRSLHPLAKQYLLRWLCITEPLPLSVINSWVLATPTSQQAHTQAMSTLWELQLLLRAPSASAGDSKSVTSNNADPLIHFNPPFQKCLQDALTNKMVVDAGLESVMDDPDRAELSELDAYAQRKWDAILHWMVGASKTLGTPSMEVTTRLVSMGLMEPLANDARAKPHITPSGFAFLFKDIQTQVWDVILAYMEGLEQAQMDRDEVLQFLFRLSFLKLGMGYPTSALSDTQRRLLHDLTAFGLIYIKSETKNQNRAPKMYYPTRLALNLSSTSVAPPAPAAAAAAASSSGAIVPAASDGYIILETTFRLYAFTTSPFHTALLGLFCRLDIALPNLLVGTITKESVRHALKNNISSNEIITYLESYARDDMKVNTPVLPENVVDQIRLWEQERNRMSLTESYLFEFDSNDTEHVRKLVLTEAFKQPEQILLHHAQKRLIVVTPDGYARLKAYKLRLNEQMAIAAQQMKQV